MCKCIYCNSSDLSVSDIISCALTGAKLTYRFVCHEHNAFTNDNFEKKAIAQLAFFRHALGLTERSGDKVKFSADIIFDNITIPSVRISDRASIYEDKKRLFPVEQDGKKFLVGNVELLKKKQGVRESDIEILDVSDTVARISFSIEELFASEEMLLTVAKIAYEWYCYTNGVHEYDPNIYSDIVDCILRKQPVQSFVQISVDEHLNEALDQLCNIGSHGLFTYTDTDGWEYVIYNFWGVLTYKVRIRPASITKLSLTIFYSMYLYDIDGNKSKSVFATYGAIPHFSAMPANDAINKCHSLLVLKLEDLLRTKTLTLRKARTLVDELNAALQNYQQTNNFERLVAYEDPERIFAFRLLSSFKQHEQNYDFGKSFNENMRIIFNCEDILPIQREEDTTYLQSLLNLHRQGMLASETESSINCFERLYLKIMGTV